MFISPPRNCPMIFSRWLRIEGALSGYPPEPEAGGGYPGNGDLRPLKLSIRMFLWPLLRNGGSGLELLSYDGRLILRVHVTSSAYTPSSRF